MRHKVITAIILCLCSLCSQAQLLYRISGNSIDDAYLFATNRYANISFLDSVPNLLKTFADCRTIVTEFAIDSSRLATLSPAAILPDSATLQSLYTTDEQIQINSALLQTLGLDLQAVGRLKPAYLTELYRNELLSKALDFDPDYSSEIFFQSVAQQTNKNIVSLDNDEETFYMLFEREPFNWQVKQLARITQTPEKEVELEREILNLYKLGQLNQIAFNIMSPDNTSTLSFSDYKVYAQRNHVWVKRLAPLLLQGSVFICLDAKYLGGDEGLIALLKAAGYKVKPLNRRTK